MRRAMLVRTSCIISIEYVCHNCLHIQHELITDLQ